MWQYYLSTREFIASDKEDKFSDPKKTTTGKKKKKVKKESRKEIRCTALQKHKLTFSQTSGQRRKLVCFIPKSLILRCIIM